jgi:predicted unusual protein kinase regulating ubiquinone biosynthesis (AarF/ABC1/UbiB family)
MDFFRNRGRFIKGVALFLRILLSYKLHGLRNIFASTELRRQRLKELHARNALLLRLKMISMRGVLIKIGQFLSSRVDILPEEYTNELSKLQDHVPPAPYEEIIKRVEQELGPIEKVFTTFDREPIASASLGQVHRACLLDGQCIVLKVQYPGIEKIIEADIRTLRFIVRILRLMYRRINLDVIFSEFSRIIHEELDYELEAKNAEDFAQNFADNPKIKIPMVYGPFSTKKVLALEKLDGIKITDFKEIDRQGIDRKEIARVLAEAYAQMFFSDGLFHGDPHPGNIFVRPGPEIVLVDFGMVDRISSSRKNGLRNAFGAIVDRDALALVRSLMDMGFMPLTRDIQPLVQFVERVFEKYRDLSATEFKAMDISDIGNDITDALQLSPSIQIPNDFILLGRVVGMLNGLGSALDPETNIIEIAAPFARRFISAEETTTRIVLDRARKTAMAMVRLPELLNEFLVTTGRGETRVEITSQHIANELARISRIGRGFIFAVLFAVFGLACVAFRLNHFDVESLWTGAFSVVSLFCLLFSLR